MDLEGFTRRQIIKGKSAEEIIENLKEIVTEFKDWEKDGVEEFSKAVFDEVKSSQEYEMVNDDFLLALLGYPNAGVSMGEFGVGSRGKGDFAVHRDIANIIGKSRELIGPVDQDDAGVVNGEGGFVTIAVDGIHSRLSEFPFLAGFHAARAALRDVYSMGSKPIALVDDVHLADDGDIGKLYDFIAGVSAVGDLTGVPVVAGSTLRVGGDMVFGDRLVASVCAIGTSNSKPLARKQAKTGDKILMTLGKGGGTIATTAIYSKNFDVVSETLNIDFTKAVETLFKKDLEKRIHALTDVTNGGIRGDANEISAASRKKLVFFERELGKCVSNRVQEMLEKLDIDPLGVSTDSLLIILPEDDVAEVKNALEAVTSVFEVGYVADGGGVVLIDSEDRETNLTPLFREAAYTRVKKVVGEAMPDDLERMKKSLEQTKKKSIQKKKNIIKWIREKEQA